MTASILPFLREPDYIACVADVPYFAWGSYESVVSRAYTYAASCGYTSDDLPDIVWVEPYSTELCEELGLPLPSEAPTSPRSLN